jgi:hydroxymethylpyrimidine pyrophosphatase-like HAD family hydrolase
VTVSHPLFLEFVAPGVSKGAALRRLARRLGIDMADVLAAGDQLNDLEMVAAAGWGVAMPHAPAALRAAARVIAPPLEEDGLARVLEELILRR